MKNYNFKNMELGEEILKELNQWVYNDVNQAGDKLQVIDASDIPEIIHNIVKNHGVSHHVSESNLTMHQLNCKTWMVKNEMGDILTEGTKQECDDFIKGWLEAERSGI